MGQTLLQKVWDRHAVRTLPTGQTGIAGSTVLGAGVMMGGQSGVAGHLVVGDVRARNRIPVPLCPGVRETLVEARRGVGEGWVFRGGSSVAP